MQTLNSVLSYIVWDVNPEIFSVGSFAIRWYGLLWALAFLAGNWIIAKMFKWEGKPEKDLDKLLLYMLGFTVIGARLGHCLFYEPERYLANPIEILKIWEGGLASHGAAIFIPIGLYLYSRNRVGQSFLWVIDRIVVVVALGGFFIRLGNLMNSEIVGTPTEVPWAFQFVRSASLTAAEQLMPRHPAQLYEAITSLLLFAFLFWLYKKFKNQPPEGLLFGLFLVILFSFRFIDEFFKIEQVDFEKGMILNMGQILSIPAILLGFVVLYIAHLKYHKEKNIELNTSDKNTKDTKTAKK